MLFSPPTLTPGYGPGPRTVVRDTEMKGPETETHSMARKCLHATFIAYLK